MLHKTRSSYVSLPSRPFPRFQIIAPRDANAAVGQELHRFRFGAGAVEDHDVAADARHGAEVGHVAGSDAALRPRPVFLAQRDERAGVAPLAEVGGGFHADAVVR